MDISLSQAESFIKDMQQLLSMPAFHRLGRHNQERNWFEYLNLWEGHYCSILEWLLSPSEGHGLGDFFIKRLLAAANTAAMADPDSDKAKRLAARIDDESWLGVDELFSYPFHAAIVAREIVSSYDKRRIDLLIVDPSMQMVIAIERKDGSLVRSDQLPAYQDWVNTHYPDYYQLFILSDSFGLNHRHDDQSDWIQLDDTWLIDALKEALIPGRLSPLVEQRLSDLLYHFEAEHRDVFFKGIEEELNQFALSHRDIIQRLRRNPLSAIDGRTFITRHLPALEKSHQPQVRRAMLLATQHHTLLKDLLSRASLGALCDRLAGLYPEINLKFEIYDDALNIGTQAMETAWEEGKITSWPVSIKLWVPHQSTHGPETPDPKTTPPLPTITLFLDLLALGEDQRDQMRELAKSYGLFIQPRWALKRLELPSTEDALNDLLRFKQWIQDMCAIAKALGY